MKRILLALIGCTFLAGCMVVPVYHYHKKYPQFRHPYPYYKVYKPHYPWHPGRHW